MSLIRWTRRNSRFGAKADADAPVSKEFLDALKKGRNGKLAITYFEWASSDYQKVVKSPGG